MILLYSFADKLIIKLTILTSFSFIKYLIFVNYIKCFEHNSAEKISILRNKWAIENTFITY